MDHPIRTFSIYSNRRIPCSTAVMIHSESDEMLSKLEHESLGLSSSLFCWLFESILFDLGLCFQIPITNWRRYINVCFVVIT